MKNFFFSFIAILLVGCQYSPLPESNNLIKIGGIAPLTGDAASYGTMVQKIINLRVEQINQAGGVNGQNIKILWEDGKCASGEAVKAAQKLIGVDKVNIITGFSCSGSLLATAPIAEKNKIILMGSITSSPEVTYSGDFVFRTFPSDASQGQILGQAAQKKFKRIGMLVEQSDYAMSIGDVFLKYFQGEIIKETFVPSESDFRTRITKLKNSDIEMLFISPQAPAKFDIIAKQLSEQDWDIPLWGNEMISNDLEIVSRYEDLFQRTKAVSASFLAPENEQLTTFLRSYRELYREDPKFFNYVGATIDSLDILVHAIQKVGNASDTSAIRDALYSTQNYNGMLGKFSFDANGDIDFTHTLLQFDGEVFSPLEK
ncbi:ABC transporter substrate-binding protein [Candidatus Gracilibacteria bacterium]|nr:ABC transporter substrate-binding protein [Candidatus Gracilibacteria bacterium]